MSFFTKNDLRHSIKKICSAFAREIIEIIALHEWGNTLEQLQQNGLELSDHVSGIKLKLQMPFHH